MSKDGMSILSKQVASDNLINSSENGRIKEEVIVDVKNVYKDFRVYFDKGNMLKERFVNPERSRYEQREVLKGISFQIRKGETVALIGNNGCGKSTILKMLTKIYYPNKGSISVKGKVSSLIELGAGFHPDMSGRENIYINASILGLKRSDVDSRIDEIIRFSELEDYIDNPIRTYSSGMYMRLAFSVAINVDADILLIDEILAVGDQAFQEKCIHKLDELRKRGTTVVLVSHAMNQVNMIADRCIWIENGEVVEDGSTESVCKHYQDSMENRRVSRDEFEKEQRQTENVEKNINGINRNDITECISTDIYTCGVSACVCVTLILMLIYSANQYIYGIGLGSFIGDFPEMTLHMRISMYFFYIFSKIYAPLSFMCLGYIFLNREYGTRKEIFVFWGKCLVCILFWVISATLYLLHFSYYRGIDFTLNSWVEQILCIGDLIGDGQYFVSTFLMLMFASPILGKITPKFKLHVLQMLIICMWVCWIVFPSLDLYGQVNGGQGSMGVCPSFIGYLWYFALGYYLSCRSHDYLKVSNELRGFFIVFTATFISQFLFDSKNINYLVDASFIGISVIAFVEFEILLKLKILCKYENWMALITKYSFVFFLIHRPIQWIIAEKILIHIKGMFSLKVVVLCVSSAVMSILIVYCIDIMIKKQRDLKIVNK